MNITLNLDAEQESALDDLLAEHNALAAPGATPDTPESYLSVVLMGVINDRVQRNFEATANALVSAAKSAPYQKRMELIALVQSQLG